MSFTPAKERRDRSRKAVRPDKADRAIAPKAEVREVNVRRVAMAQRLHLQVSHKPPSNRAANAARPAVAVARVEDS